MSKREVERRGVVPAEEADSERGAVYVLAAAAIVVLLGMAVLSVDIGWLFLNDVRAQRAADAAALAGVTHLPAKQAEAFSVARDVAARNGYAESGTITVTPERAADNELRVLVRDTGVETFFMRVFGIDTVAVSGNARASYSIPVPLGSPENFFGADPTVAGRGINDAGGPGFWAAINLPNTEKRQGDPYATQCFDTDEAGGSDSCNVANGEYYGTGLGGDPDGYWYAVEVPTGTSSLSVQAFDADFLDRGSVEIETGEEDFAPTQGPYSEQWSILMTGTGGVFTLTFDGAETAPIPFDASFSDVSAALLALPTVNDSPADLTVTSGPPDTWIVQAPFGSALAGIDLPDTMLTADGSGLTAGAVTVNHLQDGGPIIGPANVDIVFEVYDPDGSPFNYRDNTRRCRVTVDASSVYTWIELCSIPAGSSGTITPGLYPVRVFATGTGNANNAYSLKAVGNPPAGEQIRLFALDRMSIFSNLDVGATDLFLAEVEDEHRGKDFIVELFDPGDAVLGVSNIVTFLGPGGVPWDQGCRIETAVPTSGPAPVYTAHSQPSGICSFDATRTASLDDPFNNYWLRITIPLGGGYTCAGTPEDPDCWWKVRYDYGGQAHDRTTWAAKVQGSLVRLVFDDEETG